MEMPLLSSTHRSSLDLLSLICDHWSTLQVALPSNRGWTTGCFLVIVSPVTGSLDWGFGFPTMGLLWFCSYARPMSLRSVTGPISVRHARGPIKLPLTSGPQAC